MSLENFPLYDEDAFRVDFERLASDSYNFKRSRRGTYMNPAIARDWKWFQLGAIAAATARTEVRQALEDHETAMSVCPSCNGTGIDGIDRGEGLMPRCDRCEGSGERWPVLCDCNHPHRNCINSKNCRLKAAAKVML